MNKKIFNSNFIRISFASILLQSGNQIIMVVLPLFLQYIGSAPSVLGIATSLSAFAAMAARPIAGYTADKKSKKLVMVLGLLVMIAGMFGFSLFPFAAAIILIRFVQGFGISAATTAQMAIATDTLPSAEVKKGLSYFGVCATLASAFGPTLGLALVFGNNYLPAWLGGAAIFAAALIIVLTFTYEKSIRKKVTASKNVVKDKLVWRYFEKEAFFPSLVQMVLTIASAGAIVFLPTYAMKIGIKDIGLFYTLQAGTMFLSNIAVGNSFHRVRNPLSLLLPAIVCFGGSLLALFLATGPMPFFTAAILYGIGLGISTTVISAITMSSAAPERRGAASATFQFAGDMGYCVGSFVCGIVADLFGYRLLYGILILLPVLAAILCLFIFRPKGEAPNNQTPSAS